MSYYHPSFSQTVAMSRGRGFSSFRGGGGRSWRGSEGGRGSYSSRGSNRFSSFNNSFERNKYSSSDRYSSKPHYDDYHNKPSYRSDGPGSYGGRDGHRSPERKRMRPDASSSRRSHDNSYGNDSYNSSNRYNDSSSFTERRSFSRDRRPAPYTQREEFRKPSGSLHTSSSRGGYRGRIVSRGSRGSRFRDGPPRRRLVETSYTVRRRVPLRTPDYARRLKITRMRRAIARADIDKRRRSSDKDESGKEDKHSDVEQPPEKKIEVEEKIEPKEEVIKIKEEKIAAKEVVMKEEKVESDGDQHSHRKDYIKLVCPHCSSDCVTFAKYGMHLHSSRHMAAMRRVAIKQKALLSRMRLNQRNAQRELEKSADDLSPRTNFCPLCKLNYKQPKLVHQASDCHKSMKKFLMPYCRVCRITFKSPMLYETHICSIEHLKRKARSDINGEKSDKEDNSSANDEDLDNFMTIDSVGDVDCSVVDDDAKKKVDNAPVNVGVEQIRKVEVHYCDLCHMYLPRVEESKLEKILAKHCKERTHLTRYIRYKEDKEIASRAERLQRRETAEKEREKKVKQELNDSLMDTSLDESKNSIVDTSETEVTDDKLWADVDKDMGDILAEAELGIKSSDDEEETHTSKRYDRFRYSEKDAIKKTDEKESKKDEEKVATEAAKEQ